LEYLTDVALCIKTSRKFLGQTVLTVYQIMSVTTHRVLNLCHALEYTQS